LSQIFSEAPQVRDSSPGPATRDHPLPRESQEFLIFCPLPWGPGERVASVASRVRVHPSLRVWGEASPVFTQSLEAFGPQRPKAALKSRGPVSVRLKSCLTRAPDAPRTGMQRLGAPRTLTTVALRPRALEETPRRKNRDYRGGGWDGVNPDFNVRSAE
jgi:hypothetical protein